METKNTQKNEKWRLRFIKGERNISWKYILE